MNTAISVRIPKNLASKLDSIAKETERPRSFIIQKALESYIEDYADLQIALDRLHDKSDEAISAQEMRKSLGL
ncbi:MAG: ribbon-helix-helix domain-containing protein [Acidobacteria bacterium]|nr:ribbon-helix-helix domain-containing protein [Acidobacteriota bacterium]